MKQRPKICYSASQKALMWERWKQGATLHEIGKLFDRPHTSIHNILSAAGGIRPAERVRAARTLTHAEREEISRAIATGESMRCIAARLGRTPSTVSREIKRNGGRQGYRANQADQDASDRAKRPKRCKLVENPALARIVADKLRRLWSPQQIDGWLKQTCPGDHLRLPGRHRHGVPCGVGRGDYSWIAKVSTKSPGFVARIAVRAMLRRERTVVPGLFNQLTCFAVRLLSRRLASRVATLVLGKPRKALPARTAA